MLENHLHPPLFMTLSISRLFTARVSSVPKGGVFHLSWVARPVLAADSAQFLSVYQNKNSPARLSLSPAESAAEQTERRRQRSPIAERFWRGRDFCTTLYLS